MEKTPAFGPNLIEVRPARPEDLPEIVEIHVQTNPDSYLTVLGKPVLSSMYRHFIYNGRGIALVAQDASSQALVGVAIGCEYPRRFYRGLTLAMLPAYMWSSIRRRFAHKLLGVGLVRSCIRQESLSPERDVVCFTQLNVSPGFQRRGVGGMLATAMYNEARNRGHLAIYLINNQENDSLRTLYEKMGCTLVHKFTTRSGIPRCLYLRNLEAGPNAMLGQETTQSIDGRERLLSRA